MIRLTSCIIITFYLNLSWVATVQQQTFDFSSRLPTWFIKYFLKIVNVIVKIIGQINECPRLEF